MECMDCYSDCTKIFYLPLPINIHTFAPLGFSKSSLNACLELPVGLEPDLYLVFLSPFRRQRHQPEKFNSKYIQT